MAWGLLQGCRCILCDSDEETIEHLFFTCPLSKQIWAEVSRRNGIREVSTSWDTNVHHVSTTWQGKSLVSYIRRLSFNIVVYSIWKERNNRIFQQTQGNYTGMLSEITTLIRCTVLGRPKYTRYFLFLANL